MFLKYIHLIGLARALKSALLFPLWALYDKFVFKPELEKEAFACGLTPEEFLAHKWR